MPVPIAFLPVKLSDRIVCQVEFFVQGNCFLIGSQGIFYHPEFLVSITHLQADRVPVPLRSFRAEKPFGFPMTCYRAGALPA